MYQCTSDSSVPCYPQHNMDRDKAGIKTNALALGAAFLAVCGDSSPWASPVKEAGPGSVSAKTMKAMSFSSIPVQLAFWLLGRKYLVVIYFGKTHFNLGMEN